MTKGKVAVLVFDSTLEEMQGLGDVLRDVGERTGYEFILSNGPIECISKDELIKVVDGLKSESTKENES